MIDKLTQLYKSKKQIGIVTSQFDLLHAGHTLMLSQAKSMCDFLLVALHNDASVERHNKSKPVQSLVERQILLWSNKNVDGIVTYNTEKDLEEILTVFPLNYRFVGEDYKNHSTCTGWEICNKRKIIMITLSRSHNYSSSGLRKRIVESERGQ